MQHKHETHQPRYAATSRLRKSGIQDGQCLAIVKGNCANRGELLRCRDAPAGASGVLLYGDVYEMNGCFLIGGCPKTRRNRRKYSGGRTFILQLELSGQRTHLIGTSLHPASRKTPAAVNGMQRYATMRPYHSILQDSCLYGCKRNHAAPGAPQAPY